MMTPPSGDKVKKQHRRDLAILAGLFALMLIGLAGVAAATGWEETWEQIRKLGIHQVGLLLGLSLVNYLFRGLRWHLFASKLGLRTTLLQNMRHFLGGFAMSVTPGRVGELVRMRWIARETGTSFERSAPLVLVDRASDMSAMGLILAVTIALSPAMITGGAFVAAGALLVAMIVTRPSLLHWINDAAFGLFGRWPRLFARVRRAARSLAAFSGPSTLLIAAVIGAVGWWAEGYAFFLLLSWLGSEVGLSTAVAIFIFSTMAGGLTGAPGGVGGAEAAMIALLSVEGVPLEISIPATAIIRLTTLWFAIGIGLLIFPFAERQSIKATHALEND